MLEDSLDVLEDAALSARRPSEGTSLRWRILGKLIWSIEQNDLAGSHDCVGKV